MNTFLLTRFSVTFAAIIAIITYDGIGALLSITAGLYIVFIIVQGTKAWTQLAVATLLLILPLMVVHAIINPTFSKSLSVYGLPLRVEGAIYASLVGLRMALLFASVGIWSGLARNVTFALVAAIRVPPAFGFALLQAMSLTKVLARRISSIRLAQQSRGVLREGGLAQRAVGAIAMVVPLIATTLMDAHDRGDALARMGVGATRIRAPHPIPPMRPTDMILASTVSTVAIVALLRTIFNAS